MRCAGIDIGSRTIKLVVVDERGQIQSSFQADTGFDPITEAKKLLAEVSFDRIMAKNPCMATFLADKLQREVLIPENPQCIGALGAALLAGQARH